MSSENEIRASREEAPTSFEAYREFLAEEFPEAVRAAIESEQKSLHTRESMMGISSQYFQDWGFSSALECWEAAVPKSRYLNLFAWSHGRVSTKGWSFKVSARSFFIIPDGVHLEVFSLDGRALPITRTGYRSYFVPLSSFAEGKTIKDFMEHEFREVEPLVQMSLF